MEEEDRRGRGGVGRWDGGVGMRRERGRERRGIEGRGIPVSEICEVVSVPYTNSVCVGIEVSCKQS